VLIAVFWAVHFLIQWVRNELYEATGERRLESQFDGDLRRVTFALIGAILGYLLYRCLRPLRLRDFTRQAPIGAALALAAAAVQAAFNTWMFNSEAPSLLGTYLYFVLYWFWFYFSWTTAYLAMSYSITVQEQEQRAAALAVEAREAQISALRYQVNPHFLFNTLNAIAALVREEPDKAEEMVVQLSDFFRRSLAVNPMEDLTLDEEVDLQRLYLDIEQTRFSDRLRFEVSLEGDSARAKVPALLLQPLVENAVKHGVARSERPTVICIHAREDGNALEIVVENDAQTVGRRTDGANVGLRNVRDRLQSRFGDAASLITGETAEGGFRNTVRLPLDR